MEALILPGGEPTTMSRLLVALLLEPLRARLADGMPAYGSCPGMILLSREILDGRPSQQQVYWLHQRAVTPSGVDLPSH